MSKENIDRLRELIERAKAEVLDSSDSNDLAGLAEELLNEHETGLGYKTSWRSS